MPVWQQAVTRVLVIALGAAVGANARYAVSLWALRHWGPAFPYGTLIVNVLGSFLIGFIMVLGTTRLALSETWRLLLITGLLGGFTTFSSFSYEAYQLFVAGNFWSASLYLAGSMILGLLALLLGVGAARVLG